MSKRKEKQGAVLWQRIFLLTLAPAVYTHLSIQMPQTYTVSPGGDTVYPSATHSHYTLQHCMRCSPFTSVC